MNVDIHETDIKILVAALAGANIGAVVVDGTAATPRHVFLVFLGVILGIGVYSIGQLVALEHRRRKRERGESGESSRTSSIGLRTVFSGTCSGWA